MKIKILIVFLFGVQVASGQSWNKKPRFGVTSGVNLSDMLVRSAAYTDLSFETSVRGNFLLGAFAQFALSEPFSIASGITHTSYGATIHSLSLRYKFDYITVPIVVKYVLNKSSFYALTGTQTGFLLKSTIDDGIHKNNITKSSSKLDLGILFGAGITFDDKIHFEVRKSISFTNVSNIKGSGVFKNRGLSFSLGYLLY